MRVAILADIHANMYALQIALDRINGLGDVQHILSLGDLVQIGPHPAEVVDAVLADQRFVHVLGNNDTALISRQPAQFRPEEVEHQDWTIAQLGESRLSRIAEWPETRCERIAGRDFRMVHVPMPQGTDCRDTIVMYGHTHRPHYSHSSRMGIIEINPGSVGCTHGFVACFALLDITNVGFSVGFHNLHYDGAALMEDYDRLQVPDRQMIMSLFGEG